MAYKLAASNIAWDPSSEADVFQYLKSKGFSGVEVAPTRLIENDPYNSNNLPVAYKFARELKEVIGLSICSMQSIWYGRTEQLFGNIDERSLLLQYTKDAIDFAKEIGCPHIVFGSPRNRVMPDGADIKVAINFFEECSSYAQSRGVTIGLEANPTSYGTNFLNKTGEVIEFIKAVNSPSLRLNLDLGAIISNNEDVNLLPEYLRYASHVHISEPMLLPLERRTLHRLLKKAIQDVGYSGWISLEMKKASPCDLLSSLQVMSDVFFKN